MFSFPYRLCPSPSFSEGAARIFDFGDALTTFNYSSSPKLADYRAVAEDWRAVAGDLRRAFDQYAESIDAKER
jgi:hypothetical protein